MRPIWFAILAALLVSTSAAVADDGFSNDPFGRPRDGEAADEPFIPEAPWSPGASVWEEYYVQHIDLAGFMQRLQVILTSEEHLGGVSDFAEIAGMLEAMGYFDLAGSFTEYEISGDSIKLRCMSEFNHTGDSFLSRYMAVEDAPLRSAKYVAPDDYLLYLALNKVIDKALAALTLPELLAQPGMEPGELLSEMEMEQLSQALMMVQALKLDEILGSTLSGEVALVVYQAPPFDKLLDGDIMPADVHAAVMLGIDDPEYILNMANQFGPDIGLVPVEDAPEGWHAFTMMGEESLGVAFNDEILIASPSSEVTAAHVMAALEQGGLNLDPCLLHMDLDVEALNEQLVHPLALTGIGEMGIDAAELPVESMTYLLNLPDPSALGHMTATVNHPEGNAYFEFEMKKSVLSWLAFFLGVGLCGAGQAGMLH